ncbi:SH3 domain-containing protein [Thiovibrio sp. JS02]
MAKTKKTVFFLFFFLASIPALAGQAWMSVAVQNGALRFSPMPFGRIVATLSYGERVDILAEQGLWFKVREQARGREGWLHSASLVTKKLTLRPGEQMGAAASQDELALGGKGFNAQVEAEHRARDREADYTWVDWMERVIVPAEERQRFLGEGGLVAGEAVRP